jgi:lysine 6-dehydrogenase
MSEMSHAYAVLGAGQQGTYAAYDLALHGDANRITLADSDLARSEAAAARVNAILGRAAVTCDGLDARDEGAVAHFLQSYDVALCCLPYFLQPIAARAAVAARCHFCDLDGDSERPEDRKALDAEAKAQGVTLIADTGLAPGLINSFGMAAMAEVGSTRAVRLYCGVLPEHPKPPLHYKVTFSIDGLIAEYDEPAMVLRNGEIVELPPLEEVETFDFPGVGAVEAFTTGGGVSTAPYSLKGQVANYEYKTIRFPGHAAQMKLFRDLGFWSNELLEVEGAAVVPRKVFGHVLSAALRDEKGGDQCLLRAEAEGEGSVRRHDLLVRQDSRTGFTSMQQLTGACISLHAIALAQGELPPGALLYEEALLPATVIKRMAGRGFSATVSTTAI